MADSMSNAIDRLEEEYNDLKAYERKVYAIPDNDPMKVEKLDFLGMLHERFIHTFGEHAKPLLAVVRAGERVQELRKRLLSAINDKDRLGIELPGITIEILGEQCDAASDALDSALATLKETTL